MNNLFTAPLALALCVAASAASAATVVSFGPGNGRNAEIIVPQGSTSDAHGRWISNGFNVDWTYENGNFYYQDVNSLDFYRLSAGAYGYTGSGLSLDLSRRSGNPFSLLSIGLSDTLSLFWGNASFTPYDASGNLDQEATKYSTFNLKFDDFMLEGIKATGEAVSQTFSSFMESSQWQNAQDNYYLINPAIVGDGSLTLNKASRKTFSDLVSLRITSVFPSWQTNDFDYRTSIGASIVDPIFKNLPERCYISSAEGCVIPGVGQFYFWEDYYGDVPAYTTFSSFTFASAEESPEMAAVPLGGSLVFLGAGLFALAGVRRRTPVASA